MIRKIQIRNYKSIPDLTLDLGRLTVLIGANGSGKSNILEAIAFASAASQDKLDNEFLISRGIRVAEARFMRSAFDASNDPIDIVKISINGDEGVGCAWELFTVNTASYPKWDYGVQLSEDDNCKIGEAVKKSAQIIRESRSDPNSRKKKPEIATNEGRLLIEFLAELRAKRAGSAPNFLIYAPENSALREFQSEGQILPLGIRGEGLFAHLKALNTAKNRSRLEKIKEKLLLIDWFESFVIPADLSPGERNIRIRDRFLPDDALFDQRSANEGFLFLLFYVTLLISPDTPAFFAIDNIETSLNPKLCITLIHQIAALAKEHDKQVILTTHNPAVLDGLDLQDDEQRLLVVERNKAGHTFVRRVEPPKTTPGQTPVSLSDAFMRGYIGGLPKNF